MHLCSEPNHYEDYKCIHKKFLYGFYMGTKFKWVFNRNLPDHPLVKQLKNQRGVMLFGSTIKVNLFITLNCPFLE